MNGFASNIWVTLHADGSSITIEDDGRGIPVDKHPTTKKSAIEVIFTVLHAGGKFEHGSYKTAGGLHGVGASVVNALSKELVATVKRDGAQWEMRFKQGKPVAPLKKIGAARGSGHDGVLSPRRDDLSEDRVRSGDHQGTAGGRELSSQRAEGHVRR
jgi:DNA gyrase subunit B/topoisomerase-4 subunit B